MLEEAYSACQPDVETTRGYDLDDYHDYVVALHNDNHRAATAAFYALCVAGKWNPLAGERVSKWWDLFYGDQA